MSNNIILKKSSVGDKVPLASDLEHGELALNFTDGNLFYKNNSNVITTIASNKFVSVAGNVTGGNIAGTTGAFVTVTGNANATSLTSGTVPVARLNGSYTINISGAATTAATVTTAAQPNITSVGTLAALTVTGNVTTGNILTDGYFLANGVPFTGNGGAGGTFDVFARSGVIVVSVIAGFFDIVTRNSGTLKVAVS